MTEVQHATATLYMIVVNYRDKSFYGICLYRPANCRRQNIKLHWLSHLKYNVLWVMDPRLDTGWQRHHQILQLWARYRPAFSPYYRIHEIQCGSLLLSNWVCPKALKLCSNINDALYTFQFGTSSTVLTNRGLLGKIL